MGVYSVFEEFPKGWGGQKNTSKMENPGGWGGPMWNSFRGGGMDIFWNYTIKMIEYPYTNSTNAPYVLVTEKLNSFYCMDFFFSAKLIK